MSGDARAARRWLLSVLTGMAALLWLLTLSGLGGWIELDGAAQAPQSPLPALTDVNAAASERLDALEAYADVGNRPLFMPDRRPHLFVIDAGQDGALIQTDFTLTGVMMTPSLEMAILTPRDGGDPVRVHKGEGLPDRSGWELILVEPRRVVFQTPEGARQFELSAADGGAAPLMVLPGGDGAAANASMASPRSAQTDAARNLEHQARIEAARRRIAERRAQLRQEQVASPDSVQ